MNLKSLFKLFAVFTIAILTGCRKDVAVPTTPTTPFIEYRESFVGNYLGSHLSFTTVFHTGVSLYEPYDSTFIPQNYLVTVQKSTSSDSTLVLNYFGMNSVPSSTNNFKILGNGKYSYYSGIGKYTKSYSITFRNDSLYVSEGTYNAISPLTTYNSISQFKGVKQ
jgi:hypothetical protein